MTMNNFKNGLDNISSFIEKLVKVFKDLYLFIKGQFEEAQE